MKYLKLLGWLVLYLIFLLAANIAVSMVVAIFVLVSSSITGAPTPDLEEFIVSSTPFILIFTGLLTLIFAFIVGLIRDRKPLAWLSLHPIPKRNIWLAALLGVGFSMFLNSAFVFIDIEQFISIDPDYAEVMAGLMDGNLLVVLFAVGIIVPIYEEVLVRGLVFGDLRRTTNLWVALVTQGLIFGLIHGNLFQFIYTFPMGIILGLLMLKCGSIWAPILVHLTWNSSAVIMSYVSPQGGFSIPTYIVFSVVGIAVFLYCLVAIWRSGPRLSNDNLDWYQKQEDEVPIVFTA